MASINELVRSLLQSAGSNGNPELASAMQGIGNVNPTQIGAAIGNTNLSSNFGADLLKEVLNTTKKHVKMQTQQALDQGVPANNVLDTAQQMFGTPSAMAAEPVQGQQNPQQMPQQPQQAPAQPMQQSTQMPDDRSGIIAALLGKIPGVGGKLENTVNNAFDYGLKAMDVETPRYAKEIGTAKAEVQPSQSEILTAKTSLASKNIENQEKAFQALNEPLSTTKELGQVESALTGLDNITNLLQITQDKNGNVQIGNKKLLSDKNFLSKNRQSLLRARNEFINKSLRRDSGAAIGKEEEKQFKDTFGFDVGVSSFFQNPEVIAKSLIESKNQLMTDRSRLSPNEETRSFNQFLIGKGLTAAQRKKVLAESGFLG